MRTPLQEQLLKAGLVKKHKVAEAVREQNRQLHSKAPTAADEAKVDAQRLQAERAERDRALSAQRNAQARAHELQAQVRELFALLRKTVVLVTHDVAEAAFLGDTLVLLRDGRVLQQGTARALLDAPVEPFVRQFMTAQRSVEASA